MDLGFLYQQQGQAQLELQRYPASAESLVKSLRYFTQAQQPTQLGATHTLLSRAYGALGKTANKKSRCSKQ